MKNEKLIFFNSDLPNLPWMKDGDLKISQSLAILKYVARRHKLANEESPESLAMSDMIEVGLFFVNILNEILIDIFIQIN